MTRAEPDRPRFLVLKALAAATEAPRPLPSDIDDGVSLAEPGQMKLFSFIKPGLVAGDYTIQVSQDVVSEEKEGEKIVTKAHSLDVGGKDKKTVTQVFNITAPQFALPEADIHSSYPPQGHSDQPSVAPHLVFDDTHTPWERDPTSSHSGTPWLALFPFDCNHPTQPELRLSSDQLDDIKAALSLRPEAAPTPTFSITTTVGDYLALESKISSRTKVKIPLFTKDPNIATLREDPTPVQVVFLTAGLYRKLFFTNGKPDIQQFKYCAHVRNVNIQGVTGAGMADTGLFSVVHSKRSGPTDISATAAPRSQAVHLVSLEFLEHLTLETTNADGSKTPEPDTTLVALVSLYSWTYLCEPPLSVNFIDIMRSIGVQMKYSQGQNLDESEEDELDANSKDAPPNCYLQCPKSVIERLAPSIPDPKKVPDPLMAKRAAMARRMKDGLSLVRYRVQTGEETVALFRGALLPVLPVAMPASWPKASNNGQDFQMYDKELSLMNITYSAAWQLGRLMACSDIAFVSALMRVRMRAYQSGIKTSNLMRAHDEIQFKSQAHFFSSLPHTLSAVRDASLVGSPMPTIDLRSRWNRPKEELDTSVHPVAFRVGVATAIKAEGSAAGTNNEVPIQDLFSPTSEDWRIMHEWILDKMYLDGIPTQYLIPDPSMLPPESIRFFNIDTNWRNAFLDGALSCANHTAKSADDDIRRIIKTQFELYLHSKLLVQLPAAGDPSEELHLPQVPVFGFFLRSKIVSAFKDLIVEIPFKEGEHTKGKAPILVQKRLGSDILMILLDRRPETGDIPSIKFTQPPHQQRFCVADYLGEHEATYLFRQLTYTQGDGFLDQFNEEVTYKPDTPSSIYDWNSRCLNFQNMEQLFFSTAYTPPGLTSNPYAKFHQEKWTVEATRRLTSAFVGIQLNDTMKYLSILPPISSSPAPATLAATTTAQDDLLAAALESDRNLQGWHAQPPSSSFDAMTARLAQIKSLRHGDPSFHSSTPAPLLAHTVSSEPGDIFPLPQHPPSHPPSTLLAVPSRVSRRAAGPATGPRSPAYAFFVYPRETLFPRDRKSFIWRDVPYPGDVIFSIQQTMILSADIGLREIQLTIPLGHSSGRKPQAGVKVLTGPGVAPKDVGGVRVRMLNNARWVASVAVYKEVYLQIRIVPRADPRVYSEVTETEANRELSLVVAGLDTGWVGEGEKGGKEMGTVHITATEVYATKDEVLGNAVTDVKVEGRTGWKDIGN